MTPAILEALRECVRIARNDEGDYNSGADQLQDIVLAGERALTKRTEKFPTLAEIKARIQRIDYDDRYHDKPAAVQINAPLALIQVQLRAEAEALAWVLGRKPPKSGPKGGRA